MVRSCYYDREYLSGMCLTATIGSSSKCGPWVWYCCEEGEEGGGVVIGSCRIPVVSLGRLDQDSIGMDLCCQRRSEISPCRGCLGFGSRTSVTPKPGIWTGLQYQCTFGLSFRGDEEGMSAAQACKAVRTLEVLSVLNKSNDHVIDSFSSSLA